MIFTIVSSAPCTLIDSDERKCIFLRNVSRETFSSVRILNERVEKVNETFNFILSRGFARISTILNLTKQMRNMRTRYCLLKGVGWKREIDEASKQYVFTIKIHESLSSSEGRVLILSEVKEKNEL